ncbi:cob(I)yrinic acid a,c-diamide adenosyltransferase [Patescibacteria group bacterium]|nr:cob(I)yrinic acid a,c-diamide adenosyltransferase [Patescibacteria group bacterium]
MSISTKTGDTGETSLFSGERVLKDNFIIEILGTIDELNAHLGVIASEHNADFLISIQRDLYELGALIANSKSQENFHLPLQTLDELINTLEAELPPLKNFILPGGHPIAAKINLARTVCRRLERRMLKVTPLPTASLPYINRLSDFLFLLARKINFDTKTDEIIWKK